MRGTNSEMGKNRPKNYFFVTARRCNWAKSRNPQKTHLAYLLNSHTKFQPPSSICRGDLCDTNLKTANNQLNMIKNLLYFGSMKGCKEFKKSKSPRVIIGASIKSRCKIIAIDINLGGS